MGKKIPGAKHRTVKYPEQQKRLRELKLYNKINNPPKVLDDQEIPKGVRKIKEFKEKFKILEEKDERKKQDKKNRKLQKTLKVAQLKVDKRNLLERFLKKDSTEDQVIVINEMRRVKRAAQPVVTPKKVPEVDLTQSSTPSTQAPKQKAQQDRQNQQAKQRKLLTELSKEYPSLNIKDHIDDKQSSKRKMKRNPNKKLNKREKDKLKMKMKQSEKEEEVDRSAPVYDKVQFGEIVHAPPKLSKRPRNTEVESKPGKKSQNLLLASMLNPSLKVSSQAPPRKFNYSTDLTGKRKDLSMADRRRLDKEQAMAIAAYKKLKAERWQGGQAK
ncbi:hypothetical protein WDU94_007373 [Cyamophila willieti]